MSDLVLRDFDGFKMFLMKDDLGISHVLLSKNGAKYREKAFMEIVRQNVGAGDVCMDIGANIGFVTLQMAGLVGSKGKIYAIEPDENNFNVLNKNIKVNACESVIESNCIAISEEDGEAHFYSSSKSNLGSLFHGKNTDSGSAMVITRKLDTYLEEKELPVFYKMDVEGAEVLVLNGMQGIAKKSKIGTKMLIEVHPREYTESLNMKKALWGMVKLGFKFKYVVSAGQPQPKLFKEKGYEPFVVYDCGGPWKRGVYENVSPEDAIHFCSQLHKTSKIVRSIMLEKI